MAGNVRYRNVIFHYKLLQGRDIRGDVVNGFTQASGYQTCACSRIIQRVC